MLDALGTPILTAPFVYRFLGPSRLPRGTPCDSSPTPAATAHATQEPALRHRAHQGSGCCWQIDPCIYDEFLNLLPPDLLPAGLPPSGAAHRRHRRHLPQGRPALLVRLHRSHHDPAGQDVQGDRHAAPLTAACPLRHRFGRPVHRGSPGPHRVPAGFNHQHDPGHLPIPHNRAQGLTDGHQPFAAVWYLSAANRCQRPRMAETSTRPSPIPSRAPRHDHLHSPRPRVL